MTIQIHRLADPMLALGVATHYLARRAPFARFEAGALTGTLFGQVRRGHYLLALEGAAVRGYLGWAMLDTADARHFAATGTPPPEALCNGRDVVWMLTAAADSREALHRLVAEARRLHAGRRVIGVRHRPAGPPVVFNHVVRARGAPA